MPHTKIANCIDRVWLPDEEDRLRALCGKIPLPELIDTLNREFDHFRPPRSKWAVTLRANRLGLVVEYIEGYTLQRLESVVGWDAHMIVKNWIKPGLLPTRRVYGKSNPWQVLDDDLRAFIENSPWAYDPRLFGTGQWKNLAEQCYTRGGWRTIDDLKAWLGLRHDNFWWANKHRIAFKLRHHVLGGSGSGQTMIHSSQFHEIRAMLGDLNRYSRAGKPLIRGARGVWKRTCKGCGAVITGPRSEPVLLRCGFCGTSIRRKEDPKLSDYRNPPRKGTA